MKEIIAEDPDAVANLDEDESLPIDWACRTGQVHIVELLLSKPETSILSQRTFCDAIISVSPDLICLLARKFPHLVNAESGYYHKAPLVFASGHGSFVVVKILVTEFNAHLNSNNLNKALHKACEKEHLDIVAYLVYLGAKLEPDHPFADNETIQAAIAHGLQARENGAVVRSLACIAAEKDLPWDFSQKVLSAGNITTYGKQLDGKQSLNAGFELFAIFRRKTPLAVFTDQIQEVCQLLSKKDYATAFNKAMAIIQQAEHCEMIFPQCTFYESFIMNIFAYKLGVAALIKERPADCNILIRDLFKDLFKQAYYYHFSMKSEEDLSTICQNENAPHYHIEYAKKVLDSGPKTKEECINSLEEQAKQAEEYMKSPLIAWDRSLEAKN